MCEKVQNAFLSKNSISYISLFRVSISYILRSRVRMPRSGPAKLWACCFLCQHITWTSYHYNSLIGQNPRTLAWDKPNILRDIFLTTLPRPRRGRESTAYERQWTLVDLKSIFPNPLAVMYCSSVLDFTLHAIVGLTVGTAWVHRFGFMRTTAMTFLGGMFAGGCFQFQSSLRPQKNMTPYDACATCSGALTGMSASLVLSKYAASHRVSCVIGTAFIAYKLIEEYVLAPMYLELSRDFMEGKKPEEQPLRLRFASPGLERFYGPVEQETVADPRVREWGSVGGVFLGMIWAALAFSPVQQRASLKVLFDSLRRFQKA